MSFLVAIAGSLLSAFCYAEFAAKIPVAGQAYTYVDAYSSLWMITTIHYSSGIVMYALVS